jgi:hypothetical protein
MHLSKRRLRTEDQRLGRAGARKLVAKLRTARKRKAVGNCEGLKSAPRSNAAVPAENLIRRGMSARMGYDAR